jgi:hypothetical protein
MLTFGSMKKPVKKNAAAVTLALRRSKKLGPDRCKEIAEHAARVRWKDKALDNGTPGK